MLRNIYQPRLCNGTRLAVKKLMSNVVEATIVTGQVKGEDVLIPRIPMIPTDMPIQFKRVQFHFDWRLQSPSTKLRANRLNCAV
jgi:ATP-dependent DNA helicase PIF1